MGQQGLLLSELMQEIYSEKNNTFEKWLT